MLFFKKFKGEPEKLKKQGINIGWYQIGQKECILQICATVSPIFTDDEILQKLSDGETIENNIACFIGVH